MSEQEIAQLAYLLEKAKGTLTPIGKNGPDYITVNDDGVLVGTSITTGNVMEFMWDLTSDNNDVNVITYSI